MNSTLFGGSGATRCRSIPLNTSRSCQKTKRKLNTYKTNSHNAGGSGDENLQISSDSDIDDSSLEEEPQLTEKHQTSFKESSGVNKSFVSFSTQLYSKKRRLQGTLSSQGIQQCDEDDQPKADISDYSSSSSDGGNQYDCYSDNSLTTTKNTMFNRSYKCQSNSLKKRRLRREAQFRRTQLVEKLPVNIIKKSVDIRKPLSPQKANSKYTPLQKPEDSFAKKTKSNLSEFASSLNCCNEDSDVENHQHDEEDLIIDCSASSSTSKSSNSEIDAIDKIQIQNTSISTAAPTPTELDLLIELMKRDELPKATKKKNPRKGGYVEKLRNSLQKERMDQRFLMHDKRLGLKTGTRLEVLELNESLGVNWAEVKTVDNVIYSVVLLPDMARQTQVGSILEGFCDKPSIRLKDAKGIDFEIYFQPNKLILL